MTLVGRQGNVLAYASQVALRSSTIGLSGVTLAASALSPLLRGTSVTLHASGRPRVMLTDLRLSLPLGHYPLPEGGWGCDLAIGAFRRARNLPARPMPRRAAANAKRLPGSRRRA
ncbi:MAG: hypothetical protein AUH31_08180 [Armatimonadetes bacterium 13_1_40CM_64_14]|nr:MAG: hypothetical protein AUH31_08180 [Armatimonadetes bacterium 13_1_40CM_64_14]